MNPYETSTTVGQQSDIHLAGLPFQPGTEVEVIVSLNPLQAGAHVATDPAGRLLAALDHAHNSEPIGPMRRDDLYDRNNVH
jgi:hypothetical protein